MSSGMVDPGPQPVSKKLAPPWGSPGFPFWLFSAGAFGKVWLP
jgi:hypothetical protein